MTGGVYPGLDQSPEKEKEKPPLPSDPDRTNDGDVPPPTGSWQRGKVGTENCLSFTQDTNSVEN